MTMGEYNQIVRIINNNTYERQIYLEIERQLQARGYQVPDISYADYVRFRNRLDAMNRVPYVQAVKAEEQKSAQEPLAQDYQPEERKKIITWNCLDEGKGKGYMVIAVIFALIALVLPEILKGGMFCLAIMTFVVGIVYLAPPPKCDSDYFARCVEANEEARIKTEAYLLQAHLHKGEIRSLYEQLNKK